MSADLKRSRMGSIRLPSMYDASTSRYTRSHSPDSLTYRHKSRSKSLVSKLLSGADYYFWSLLALCRIRRPRSWMSMAWSILLFAVVLVLIFRFFWELHIELSFYSRRWVAREVVPIKPLSGCFNKGRISPQYNITAAFAPKQFELHSGNQMRLGMDCYDFAGTIPRSTSKKNDSVGIPQWNQNTWTYPGGERMYYHTYWRVGLNPFDSREEYLVKSFLATQDVTRSTLILWTNHASLKENPKVARWLQAYPHNFEVQIIDLKTLAKDTELEGSPLLALQDEKAWLDGDVLRLLVLWAVGGVWVDMDELLVRDLAPLLEHEFVSQWDCYDKIYQPFNGAIMHFFKHSPYLCEAFHIARSATPRHGSTDLGSMLYHKVWRRLLASGIPPFKILPFCFTDARSCRLDNRLPDPFKSDPSSWMNGGVQEGGKLDEAVQKIFSVHLHNQWEKKFPKNGWVDRLLLRRYDAQLQRYL